MTHHNRAKAVKIMGVECGTGYGYGAIGIVLVLYVLLVIILSAGFLV